MLKGYSDVQLAELYNGGNANAFTVLSDRYFKLIRSITSRYNISGLEPDDLTQEGLLGLLSAVKSYKTDKGASFNTYAAVCINRRIVTLLKRSGNSKKKALNNYVSLDDDEVVRSMTEGGVNPEEMFIDRENLSDLEKSISIWLSEKEKRVLELYIAGESYGGIGAALGLSKKSVDNALQRIKRKLRKNISNISL